MYVFVCLQETVDREDIIPWIWYITNKPHVTGIAEGLRWILWRHVLQLWGFRDEWLVGASAPHLPSHLHAYEDSPGNQWRIGNARHEMIIRGARGVPRPTGTV